MFTPWTGDDRFVSRATRSSRRDKTGVSGAQRRDAENVSVKFLSDRHVDKNCIRFDRKEMLS